MKGIEMPVSFIVIVVIGLIVIVVATILMGNWWERGKGNIANTQKYTDLCTSYSEIKCRIADAILKYPTLGNDLGNICVKLGYSSPDECADMATFDEKCGRKCCRNFCMDVED